MEKKSFLVTELLCLFLGCLGVHRYYTGYIGLGVLQTLTLGGCGIWSFIDFIFISLGKFKDAKGQELEDYNQNIGVGALILVLVLGIFKTFGFVSSRNSNNSNTVINNYSAESTTVDRTTNEKGEQVLKFKNATCTVTANSYSCLGLITDVEKEKVREIQKELRSK